MNAQLNQIEDRISRVRMHYDGISSVHEIEAILSDLIAEVKAIDARLEKAEGSARRANNIASCLANGIQPD